MDRGVFVVFSELLTSVHGQCQGPAPASTVASGRPEVLAPLVATASPRFSCC